MSGKPYGMTMPASGPKGATAGQHDFAMIPRADIQRSVFNRSCSLRTSFDPGLLIPVFVDEALPGDTFNLDMASFVRMTTPIFPLMDNVYLDFFFFAVPNRLLWNNWERFNGAQDDPGDSTDFEVPLMTETVVVNTLSDYMGIPPGATRTFASFWHRGYNLIWNTWFRDENLQTSVVVDIDDGPDTPGDYVLKRRGKRHDYFTSCLPFAQKGTPVSLPLGTSAPVFGDTGYGSVPLFSSAGAGNLPFQNDASDFVKMASGVTGEIGWSNPHLAADLSAATAATINDIRQAFQIQRLLERDARGGSRYAEIVRSHFGVVSPDARLQRPEFLGGGSQRVNFHPVASTNESTSLQLFVGALGGFGIASGRGAGFVKSFTEHCVVLGLVCVRADLTYQQGMERMFNRRSRFDYYWPALAHLGEQAVLNKEIFYSGDPGQDDQPFGYQERWAEYRYKPSRTSGLMRSTAATSIDQWHLGIEFSALPVLNGSFIEENAPFDRVVAITSEPKFFGDFWFNYRCARPMPTYSVPGLIDHF